jgi:hypothetical protein
MRSGVNFVRRSVPFELSRRYGRSEQQFLLLGLPGGYSAGGFRGYVPDDLSPVVFRPSPHRIKLDYVFLCLRLRNGQRWHM